MRKALASLCVAVVTGIAGRCAGDEAAAPLPPSSVRVDVQMVSVPVAEAGKLVPALQDRKTADAAWTRVQSLIAQGEATLLAWPVVWVANGVRSAAEEAEELRYATEFSAPERPTIFERPPPSSPTWGPSSPTAFETRNMGALVEVEAKVEPDGQAVALALVSQRVQLLGFREWRMQRSPLGMVGVYSQPDFQTSKVTTQLLVQRDQPVLAGVFVVSKPRPHVELHILHARFKMLPPSAPPLPQP